MDYSKEFFDAQKNMFDNFQKMYTPMWFGDKKSDTYSEQVKNFFDMQQKFMQNLNTDFNPFTMYQKMMEIPGFDSESFKTFLDMQKQYFENLQKASEFYTKGFGENTFAPFNFQNMPFNFQNMNEAFDKYKDFYSQYDFSKIFDPKMNEIIDKMFNANKFYLYMYDFWNKLNDEFSDVTEENYEKFQDFVNKNMDLTYNMVLSCVPNELKMYFEQPKELIEKYFDTLTRFYSPWKDELSNLRDLLVEGTLENDPEKVADFFKLWKKQYDETFGKILNSPALGVNRNTIEQQNKSFDRFIDLLIIGSEFTTRLSTVQNNAFRNIMKDYAEITKESLESKSFEEFFDFWSEKMDKYMIDYFGSPEFSKMLGQLEITAMDFRLESNKLVEDFLSDTPLVTKNNLDGISKNIYNLKKEVKALKKEIEELKAQNLTSEKTPEKKEKKETK